jgi:hypothetical protein
MLGSVGEAGSWRAHLRVDQYDQEQVDWVTHRSGVLAPTGRLFEDYQVRPGRVVHVDSNLMLTSGLTRRAQLLIGVGQALTATACRIGVGTSSAAAAAGQTDLQAAAGSANRWFQILDGSYPQASGAVATFRATFGAGDANFAWNEWGLDVGTPTVASSSTVNTLINRKVQAVGTKSGGAWVATASITLS